MLTCWVVWSKTIDFYLLILNTVILSSFVSGNLPRYLWVFIIDRQMIEWRFLFLIGTQVISISCLSALRLKVKTVEKQ